jgi:MIP family channel proteins
LLRAFFDVEAHLYNLPQKLLAEFVGTFTFVFVGAGAICADQYLHSSGLTTAGLLGVALAQGFAFGVMVMALGHISGGHFNPAITIGLWVTKRVSTLDTLAYGASQLAGAVLAAYVLTVVVPEPVWRAVGLGTPDLAADFSRAHGMLLEGLTTFFLVFVVFASSVDPSGIRSKTAGIATGLTVTMNTLAAGPFTGAAMNPARAFGPALVARHWMNHGVYWVGPLIGGVLAAWFYNSFLLKES